MSSLLALIAVAATFVTVFLAVSLATVGSADRRRTLELLRTQVGSTANLNLREQALGRPFVERVMAPVVSGLAGGVKRLTPVGTRQRIAEKLVLAGNPAGWDADRVVMFKVVGIVALGLAGYVLGAMAGLSGVLGVALIALCALIGWAIPGAALAQAVERRQTSIRKALPDTLDMLTISVEAGLGFDAALLHVTQQVPGALSQEIGRMLHEMQLGVSRVDAFRHLGERTNVEELKGLVLAMVQADVFGVSIAGVLRAQSHELRIRRRQRAEEKALKLPVKLLFPMILCIFPALMVVIAGPAVVKIMHAFFGPGGVFTTSIP